MVLNFHNYIVKQKEQNTILNNSYYQKRILFKLQNHLNCHVTSIPIGETLKRDVRGAG